MTSLAPSPPVALTDLLDLVETAANAVTRRLPAHVARDDLASAGKLALVTALANVVGDEDDVRAYCFVRVRGAMLDELRRLDTLSRTRRTQAKAIARVQLAIARDHGREATLDELATGTQLPLATISAVLAAKTAERDLEDDEWNAVPDTASPSPVECVELSDLQTSLRAALDRLPANQALALRLYYLEDATLDAIADQLGVSRERARQVREAGEKRLRADFVVSSLWQALLGGGVR